MIFDSSQQVGGAAVVEEEDPLPHAPQWSGSKLVRSSLTLEDIIGQSGAHIVQRQVREQVRSFVTQRIHRRVPGHERWRMTLCAPDRFKYLAAIRG